MTVSALLEVITRWSFVVLGALTTADYIRRRERDRLDIALMFASLGGTILLQEILKLLGAESRWTLAVTTSLTLAQPYLLLRLVDHFRPLPPSIRFLSLGGYVASALLAAAIPEPRPLSVTLFIIAYFGLVESYAAVAFTRGAMQTAGLSHIRLTLIAWGSGQLAAAIFLAGVQVWRPSYEPTTAPFVFLLALGCGGCYYLGFAPPVRLRQAWRFTELYRFLQRVTRLPITERTAEVLLQLCLTAGRMTAGVAQLALLPDPDGQALVVHTSTHNTFIHARFGPEATTLWEVWNTREPALIQSRAQLDAALVAVATRADANAAYIVPIATPEGLRGLLLVLLRRVPLFYEEHIDLLMLLGEQAALILEHAALVDEQRTLINRLEATNHELEAFSYSVSHDLRSPLRGIDGFSQALLEDYQDRLDVQGVDYLQRVRAASQRMAQLIDDILQLSRVTRAPLRNEQVDLSAIATAIASDLQDAHPQRQVTFRIADGIVVHGDSHLLRLALTNFLNNAWKFTARHTQAIIEFGVTNHNGTPAYYVRDDGAGFDMAYADKLFGAFQRLHPATEFDGTGIGLATVQRVIHRHGGRVWAEGRIEKGATFYFTLPATPDRIGGQNGEQQIHLAS
jgi:signal transduction histidine kinase